MMMCDDLMCT